MVGDIELGEAYLASLGKPWSLLIQQFRPCKLAKKDHLLPHQSVIKSIFFQQLTPHVGNIIFNRFKQLFGGHFPPDADLLEAAVQKVIESGLRTDDVLQFGMTLVSDEQMGTAVITELKLIEQSFCLE